MSALELSFASGEESLSVRRFAVEEAMSTLFSVAVWARSPNDDLDFDALVGQPAALRVAGIHGRRWAGICNHIELIEAEPTGLSTYHLTIVPSIWLLTQRTNHRIFQRLSAPDIVRELLAGWGIEATWRIDAVAYPSFEYRVQYGESDFDFMSRILEEAGISYLFVDDDDGASRLVFSDHPQHAEPRDGGPIRFVDKPSHASANDYVSQVQLTQEVRPSRVVDRDFDFSRPPAFKFFGQTTVVPGAESALEVYQYTPGAFSALQLKTQTAPAPAAPAPASDGGGGGQGIGDWMLDELKQAREGVIDAVDNQVTNLVEDEVTSALNKAVTRVAGKLAGGIASDIVGGLSGDIAGDIAGQAANTILRGGRGALHLDLENRIRNKVTEVVDKRIGGLVDDKVTGFVQKTVGKVAGKAIGDATGQVVGDAVGGLAGRLSGGLAGRLTGGLAHAVSNMFRGGSSAPLVADDKGAVRYDEGVGSALAMRQLESLRADRKVVVFGTNAFDLRPGVVFSVEGHPRGDLGPKVPLLSVGLTMEGTVDGEWSASGRAVFAEQPYRPPILTKKPVIHGVQSAIVVGPKGEEIYTDEVGRVRVQFHWDRAAPFDDNSSLWMRVSQGWGGGGYGMIAVPRVGHEVLVAFLEGDPDHPVVVGRVYNGTAPVPHKLPANKTVTTFRTASSPGGEGFNELTFEDAKGRELVFVHAERNLKKLVKHDETEITQRDRHITVGDNLTKLVMVDETETTGADRTLTVGGTLTETVGVDHKVTVGANQRESIAKNLQLRVGPLPPEKEEPKESATGAAETQPTSAASSGRMADAPGANVNAAQLTSQLERAQTNGWNEAFSAAESAHGLPAGLLSAIASRETNMRDVVGDQGHGRGAFQIDDRSHQDWLAGNGAGSAGQTPPIADAANYAAQIVQDNMSYGRRNGVAEEDLLKFSISAYNTGPGNALRGYQHGDSDQSTTGHDYARDVLARHQMIQGAAGAAPEEQDQKKKEEEVGVLKIQVEKRLEIEVGQAKLTIEKSGKVRLQGVDFDFTASGPVKINGSVIDLN